MLVFDKPSPCEVQTAAVTLLLGDRMFEVVLEPAAHDVSGLEAEGLKQWAKMLMSDNLSTDTWHASPW